MEVIPAYDQLQQDFKAMEDDTTLPAVCRVAAHAAYLMTQKYYSHVDECEAYFIAIGQSGFLLDTPFPELMYKMISYVP